jgi:hypothetical protein
MVPLPIFDGEELGALGLACCFPSLRSAPLDLVGRVEGRGRGGFCAFPGAAAEAGTHPRPLPFSGLCLSGQARGEGGELLQFVKT